MQLICRKQLCLILSFFKLTDVTVSYRREDENGHREALSSMAIFEKNALESKSRNFSPVGVIISEDICHFNGLLWLWL
jgi:hypothetical protein